MEGKRKNFPFFILRKRLVLESKNLDFVERERECVFWVYVCEIILMGRAPCCDKKGLKKGPWTPEEDEKLVEHIKKHGQGNWRSLPKLAG